MVNNSSNLYAGADYGFDQSYADEFSLGMENGYQISSSEFGFPTDPRTSNQLDAVSKKLSTGAKSIEVQGTQAAQFENMPDQHLVEINRLKKLTGVDLTFHGPLIDPAGVTKQGWNTSHREHAERQMWSAVDRAHKMDPDGNIVITFHSSNGLPDPQTTMMTEVTDPVTGEKKEIEQIKEFWVMDENSGRLEGITPSPDYFKGTEKDFYGSVEKQKKLVNAKINEQNKEAWFRQLQGVSYHANQGSDLIKRATIEGERMGISGGEKAKEGLMKYYKLVLEGKGDDFLKSLGEQEQQILKQQVNEISHGDVYLRDSYQAMQKLFNDAYNTAVRNNAEGDLKKLDVFRGEMKDKLKYIEDPSRVGEFAEMLVHGVNTLRAIDPPKALRPLREFAVDKSSETFSNLAFESYKKFKNTAPIISIENPPAGTGMARADDLRDVVEAAREKLRNKLVKDANLSVGEAKRQAEKLIGVTWDVGHINMIRKFGYGDKELLKETEKVGPYVKNIHLSDNFGMEHTELPMGMGNVPTKKMMEILDKYNKKINKVVETGTWFGPQAFGTQTPFRETLRAFGSPIYSMQMGPNWSGVTGVQGGYSAGQGQILPEQHFSMYGAGFSNLPVELGGQMAGRSRMSGAPIE